MTLAGCGWSGTGAAWNFYEMVDRMRVTSTALHERRPDAIAEDSTAHGLLRGVDLLVVLAAAIVPTWWLLSGSLVVGHDTYFHLLRLQALDDALRSGESYPRWFERFAFGYGYPVLQYYAPLFYYLGEGIHLLGLSFAASANVAILVSRTCGGFAINALAGRLLRSRPAGVLAAVAFLLAPYQLTDLFARGAWSEVLALNLLPVACLAVDRLIARPTMRRASACSLAVGLLVLAHQTTVLVSAAFLAVFAVLRLVDERLSGAIIPRLGRTVLALGLSASVALALAAFYWYPAISSRSLIALDSGPGTVAGFVGELVSPGRVAQASVPFDHTFPASARLGFIGVAVALTGLAASLLANRRRRWILLVCGLAWALAVLLMTTPSRHVWQALPFVTMMQFPFRMLMYAETAAAMLAGGLAVLPWRRVSPLIGVLAAAAISASSLWALQPWTVDLPPGYPNDASYARNELDRRYPQIGTTIPAQFLPVTVTASPDSLWQSLARDAGPAAEVEASVTAMSVRGADLDLTVESGSDFLLRYRRFYFPDWRATVNGNERAVGPSGTRGIVSVPLAAGRSVLQLTSGNALDWRVAEGVSVVALALVLAMLVGPSLRSGLRSSRRPIVLSIGGAIVLMVAIAALALGGRHGPTWTPASVRYGFGTDLTGWSYRVDRDAALPSFSLDLLWFARRDLATDGEVVIRLLDERGRVVGESSRQPLWGASPTSTWERGELVRDSQALPVPVGIGERDYRLAVGWRTGSAEPEMREVGAVRVAVDVASPSSAVPEGFVALGGAAENGLTVVAYRVEPTIGKSTDALTPGEMVRLSLLLRAGREVSSDAAVSAFFVGPAGEKIAVRDTYPPQLHDFTGAWLRGESRVVTLDLPMPADLPDGFHHLAFELYDYRTGERIPVRLASANESQTRTEVATLRFVGPPRAPERAVRATFGDGIALAGYDLGGSDQAIRPKELLVALHWRASKVPTRDYKVFVHLYDESGKLVAQHDGSPSGGRLPTTDWRVDENLLDRHALVLSDDLPSGDYRLVVGLYDPQTGQRLPVEGGADSVELGRVQLH